MPGTILNVLYGLSSLPYTHSMKYYYPCPPAPLFQIKKLKHVEVKYLTQGHMIRKGGSRACAMKHSVILPQSFC